MSDNASDAGPTQLDTVWSGLVEDLPPNQRAWLAGSRPVTRHASTAISAVADEFTRNQIEGRLRTRLEDALGNAFQRQVRIAVTVDPELGGLDRVERPGDGAPYRGEYGGAVDVPPRGPGASPFDTDDDLALRRTERVGRLRSSSTVTTALTTSPVVAQGRKVHVLHRTLPAPGLPPPSSWTNRIGDE